ncbi:hypothetical protein Tco_0723335 [Tanacetum coccineum]
MLHASGLGDKVGSQPKVLDESQDKTTRTDEGTSTKPGVPDVPKYLSESENESWVDSGDDNNDDDSNEVTKDDDENDVESDANEDKEEEEKEEEDVHTLDSFEFNDDDEDYDELYKDVNVRLKVAEHEEVGKGDAEMTDTAHENASHEKLYEQVIEDAHVTLTSSQNTEVSKQSSSISSNFASKFINLDNVSPVIDEVASMMNVKTPHEESSTQAPLLLTVPVTSIPKTSTVVAMTVPLIIQPFSSIPQMTTPTRIPTTEPMTSSIPALPDFASLFRFDQRVSTVEQELSQVKQVDHSLQSYTIEFEKKSQAEKEKYIDIFNKSMNEIIKDENVVLAISSSQPQSTYEAAAFFIEFELKKILLDKLEKSKSHQAAEQHKNFYDALVISYQLDKYLFDSYDTEMPQDQGDDLGNTEDQPNVKEASKHDWFKKPKRPPTPDRKPPLTFDELMSTPIDFSAYVLNNLKIKNLTQEYLVGPDFNLLKGTCKSRVELEYYFEEYYKALTDKLDWMNPKGHEYPFALSKPLPLIEDQGRQVVHANYFFNIDLDYLKGGSLSSKYKTSTTKTKAAKYDTIEGIEDMVQSLWSPVKVSYDKYAMWGISYWVTHVQVMKKYVYRYLKEIIVRREDQSLHKFVEGDFPRLNLRDIEDMLLLLVKKTLQSGKR